MTVIVFPPKPPALSELVARLERLVSLNLPKSSSAQAVKDWFRESKDIEVASFLFRVLLFVLNFVDSDFYPLRGFSWQPPVQAVIDPY